MRADLAAALATLDTCEAEHAATDAGLVILFDAHRARIADARAAYAAARAAIAAHGAHDAAARAAEDASRAAYAAEDAAAFAAARAADAADAAYSADARAARAAEDAAARAALALLTPHESACFFAIADPHRVYGAGRAALIRIAVNMARVGQLRPVA